MTNYNTIPTCIIHSNNVVFIMPRDKQKKFVELAELRVNSAIKSIRLLGNLANKRNYVYSDEQANKILAVLDSELKELRAKFKTASRSNNTKFKL